MTQLSDEMLIAYTDGELGPDQKRVIDGVLAVDDVTRAHFQQLEMSKTRLAGAFATMLQVEAKHQAVLQQDHEARSSQAPVDVPRETGQNYMVPAVAAGMLLLSVGGIGGYLAANSGGNTGQPGDPFASSDFWNKDQMKAEEARSKALFNNAPAPKTTAATQRRISTSAKRWYELVATRHRADAASLLDRFDGKSSNRELALFQFPDPDIAPTMIPALKDEQLLFVGATPVKIAGNSFAQLTYRDLRNGALPVGLYVGAAAGGSLTLERGYMEDDNYVRWTQGKRSYMLIGAVPHWRLIVLSVAVQRQLVR